jgi:uncharacterized protein (TIGR02646 family)
VIRIERCGCPPSLDSPGSSGVKERVRAEKHFGDPATRAKTFTFRAYKRDDVREALRQMFSLKCAYCETVYAADGPMTVEHYRPKGGYDLPNGDLQLPGYWWLGSTWTNLLPSCTDCNSERGHDYEGTKIKTGKGNRFPLVDETRRATSPGNEEHEEPLLLNPTLDDPDDHLEFIDEGVVRAAEGAAGESDRGRETIDVLGLRRRDLVTVRHGHLEKVDAAIERCLLAVEQLDREPGEFARKILLQAKKELKEYMDDSAAYAGMARQRIKRKLEEAGLPLPT